MEAHAHRVATEIWGEPICIRHLIPDEDKYRPSMWPKKCGTPLLRTGGRHKLSVCRAVASESWNGNSQSWNGNSWTGSSNGNGGGISHGNGNGNGRTGRSTFPFNGAGVKDNAHRNGVTLSPTPSRLEHQKGQRTKLPKKNLSDTTRTWEDGSDESKRVWDEPEGPHHVLLDDDPLMWMTGRVCDYMTRQPLCLHKSVRLRDAAQMFLKHGISGAPVVEKYENDKYGCGRLVGVISQKDLIWKETMHPQEADSLYKMPFYWNYLNAGPMMETLQKQVIKIMSRTVEDSMNAEPLSVDHQASISEASELMLTAQVSRLAVVAPRENGKPGKTVVGVLTGNDILRHVMLLL